MKIKFFVLFVFLITSALILSATAISNNEKILIGAQATKYLMNSEEIQYGLAEFGYGNTMDIWFLASSANQETVMRSLGVCTGVYAGMCKIYPEISDLNLMVGTKDEVAGEFYCERSWVDEIGQDSDGSWNSNDCALVALKILETFKKT